MDSTTMRDQLAAFRVIPVVSIDDAADAVALADALAEGGLPLIEVTFRTPAAADAIARIRADRPDILVGAGTVLDPATVDRAVAAGAAFLVAPGFGPAVVARAQGLDIAIIPGAVTPTELEAARAAGISLVKFFPAEAAGGARYIRAVTAPYPEMRFVPTGGVTLANLAEYLAIPAVVACGGTWIAPTATIRARDWTAIRDAATAAVSAARGDAG